LAHGVIALESAIPPAGQLETELKQTILLVEDDIDTRWTTAEHLRAAGFQVREAANVAEAFAVIHSGAEIDLVFSDINMPGAADGYALARWCKEHRPALPVILTSGKPEDPAAYVKDRLSRFVQKPYDLDRVVELIGQLLVERL
jgi:DNA-binding NtrC family response regulator